MKWNAAFAAPCLFLLLFIHSSCHKDQAKPPSSPTDSLSIATMNIHLAMPADTSVKNYELIISEPSGKVLLDTVTPPAMAITSSLRTNDTLVDLSLVQYSSTRATYYITSYHAIDPSSWTTPVAGNGEALVPLSVPTQNAQLLYTNVPNTSNFQFTDTYGGSYGWSYISANHTTTVNYPQEAGNYAYLLMPDLGLYSMQIPKSLKDTIDCTHLDTVGMATLNLSPNYTFSTCFLYGMTDSTNPDRTLLLYINPGSAAQVLYPKKNILKFMLFNVWSGTGGYENVFTYNYADTITRNFDFPAPGSYTISSNANTHFSVQFNAARPTYYLTQWGGGVVSLVLFASGDSTTLNPVGMLTAQKSKLLQGVDLTALAHQFFGYTNVPGYSYEDYFSLECNPALQRTKRIAKLVQYSNKF